MTIANLPAPVLITTPEALRSMVEVLAGQRVVAVDTESNSLHAYREQVCLVQFSTDDTDYLVDPLALRDLSALGPLFGDAQIQKVFHAAEYDLLCLKRDFGFEFANLFDTMVAARVLGRDEFGLGSLLEAEFGVHLDKRYQRADWGQRPLPPHLLAYARLDTRFLIPLMERMKGELLERGLWPLALEDFTRMCRVNGHATEDRVVDCWRVSGAAELTPQQAAILVELCRYRDRVARNLNRPLFKVLNDRTLVAIATMTPGNLRELGELPGMSKGQVERHGPALLAAIERGLRAEPVYPPRSPRPSEDFLERLEALRNWRKTTAQEMGVKSDVVLPRDLLFALAERNPRQAEELGAVLGAVPWRLEHFGGQILGVLKRHSGGNHRGGSAEKRG